jgi:diaminopropionate ammonia-lyase
MAETIANPWRGRDLPGLDVFPSTDAAAPARLLGLCPAHRETPLVAAPGLARAAGVAAIWLKDERARMGLGSFKALGAAYALAHAAAAARGDGPWQTALAGRTFVAASAGNHGLSLAAGARLFGARAVIFLAETVPDGFAARLAAKDAEVVRAGADYQASMAAAEAAAAKRGWTLLSDSAWPGYTELPRRVMEGYLQLAAEAARQLPALPDLIVLQAGVGGLAGAVAAFARTVWGDGPRIAVVEPAAAPALLESIRAGRLVTVTGPDSAMGRLDCKTPSLVALAGLARDADLFVTVTEAEAAAATGRMAAEGLVTTPSGAAGVAALLAGRVGAGPGDRVLAILSEGPEDG